MNYKKEQAKYKEMANRVLARYDSGKRYSNSGELRIKGVPFVNEEKRKLKEERKLRKQTRKEQSK